MKHWIEFVPSKTRETQMIGKIALPFLYELREKEILYKNALYNCQKIEKDITEALSEKHPDKDKLKALIAAAKEKANEWNATPTNELKNPNKIK
jgi:hypothetical protein